MQGAFNRQLNAELYSSYLYLSMSTYFEASNLRGFANWMRVQAAEEMVHVMKFYQFINERGGQVLLTAIEAPPTSWDFPLAAFQQVLAHEQKVTGLIGDLANLAQQQGDHAAYNFLQWFVAEQVEEEASASAVVQNLQLIGAEASGLLMLDRELGARVFVLPPGTPGAPAAPAG